MEENKLGANTKLYLSDNDILFLEMMNEPNVDIINLRIFPNEEHKNKVLSANFKGDIYYCPNINFQRRFYCNLEKRKKLEKEYRFYLRRRIRLLGLEHIRITAIYVGRFFVCYHRIIQI